MPDVDDFLADLRSAAVESQAQLAVKEVLDGAIARPGDLHAGLGEPTKAEIVPLIADDDLAVFKVVWAPGMSVPPHDHLMWAAIGIYEGREDNSFYRRHDPRGLAEVGGKTVDAGNTLLLGADVIHAVRNPLPRYVSAIHVYGGDYLGTQRSLWDRDTFKESPTDSDRMRRIFDQANEQTADLD